VSQGLTAAGGDIGDLFSMKPGTQPNTYELDGQEHAYEETIETIHVKGGADVSVTRKLSKLGPIVNSALTSAPADVEYALRHVNLWKENDHSLVGAMRMFQAKNLDEYRSALEHWYAPGANALYAGADGHIAYHTALAIPKRSLTTPYPGLHGRVPYDGSTSTNDWGDVLTADERPHNIDPSDGYLLSGNHLIVGDWFPYYTGTAGNGDTDRSFRLRYLLASKLRTGTKKPWDPVDPDAKMTPDEVFAIHKDSGSDVVRITRDALAAIDQAGGLASAPQAKLTLTALQAWKDSFTVTDPVTQLATSLAGTMPGLFRAGTPEKPLYPELACAYGGSFGGLTHMLRLIDKGELDPNADAFVKTYLIDMAVKAWAEAGKTGDPSTWKAHPITYDVLYQANFYCSTNGSGSPCALSPAGTTQVQLDVNFGGTILSQQNQSYSQLVDFADIESSKAILPPGINENPSSPLFANQVDTWKAGDLYVSPMDKALVMDGALGTTDLEFGAP
jgi:penicillin amidase